MGQNEILRCMRPWWPGSKHGPRLRLGAEAGKRICIAERETRSTPGNDAGGCLLHFFTLAELSLAVIFDDKCAETHFEWPFLF